MDLLLVFIGVVLFILGIFGFKFYRLIDSAMFGNYEKSETSNAGRPPEFLILPMMFAVLIGALFVASGINNLSN